MRFLGIDYGSKRVGLSISDEGASLAFPYSVITNDKDLISKIESIIASEEIMTVIVGESKDFSGNANPIMKDIESFIDILKAKINIPIILESEFLSSFQAENVQSRRPDPRDSLPRPKFKEKKDLDASAAAIILQSYLDRNR
jgi:putative holliday junction resolvase